MCFSTCKSLVVNLLLNNTGMELYGGSGRTLQYSKLDLRSLSTDAQMLDDTSMTRVLGTRYIRLGLGSPFRAVRSRNILQEKSEAGEPRRPTEKKKKKPSTSSHSSSFKYPRARGSPYHRVTCGIKGSAQSARYHVPCSV